MYIISTMSNNGKFQLITSSPIGLLGIRIERDLLTGIEFLDGRSSTLSSDDPVAVDVTRQLQDYFSADAFAFHLPLYLDGTDFQRRVWQLLARIKPGQVRTYGDIAQELDTSPRAVGNACRSNPVPIVIPCHRVVSASGIGGFAGTTSGRRLDTKRWLLAHEGVCL